MLKSTVDIVDNISTMIINPIISLLFAVGFLVFMWGLVEFIANPTDPTIKKKGKDHMMYGILGLLIMLSVWGIVHVILDVIGVNCDSLSNGAPCTSK